MPWTAADADRHISGLSAHQRAIWARVANASLSACQRAGGDTESCEARSLRQAAAVARRAPAKSVKVGPDGRLDILAIPFGGPFGGKDFDGEFFSERTDLCLKWFPSERPLLYEHGLDGELSVEPIGRVDVTTARKDGAVGWWVKAQLDKSSRYWQHVAALLEADAEALFASSGAMTHLVKTADDGEILRWPWVELSLTTTPANLFATVEPATARKHYQAAGLDLPDLEPEIKAEWTAAVINDLPDSSFAVILPGGEKDEEGKTVPRSLRKLPHHGPGGAVDMPHLRNALSREPQADMPATAHATAHAHLMRHAKGAGMGKDADIFEPAEPDAWPEHDETTMAPDGAKGAGLTYSDELDAAHAAVAAIVARTRSLAELRAKDGRVLSQATRKRMTAMMESMRQLIADMDEMMAGTDQRQAVEAAGKVAETAPPELRRLVAELRATQTYYRLGVYGRQGDEHAIAG